MCSRQDAAPTVRMNNRVTSDQDTKLAQDLVHALSCLEAVRHALFTPRMGPYLESLGKIAGRLQQIVGDQTKMTGNQGLGARYKTLRDIAGQILQIHDLLEQAVQGGFQSSVMKMMRALRIACRVQEALFPYHLELEPLNRFWMETGIELPPQSLNESPEDTGLFHIGSTAGQYERGGYSVYVPDTIAADHPPPLIIALHGGFGHGRDFIWTWVRETRSRGCILLAPTSRGDTWSIQNPEEDREVIEAGIAFIRKTHAIDTGRMLITGVSDGATYGLASLLQADDIFTHCALVAGTLPPGDLKNARGKRIFWVHGSLDWMFPIQRARLFSDLLSQQGAQIVFREIPDLSHTYPRFENPRILDWFKSIT